MALELFVGDIVAGLEPEEHVEVRTPIAPVPALVEPKEGDDPAVAPAAHRVGVHAEDAGGFADREDRWIVW